MLFYLILFLTILVLSVFFPNRKTDFLIVGLLLIFSMFRGDDVGIDTSLYLNITDRSNYDLISENSASYAFEITFNFVIYIISNYSLDPHFIIYFFSIVTFIFLVKAFKRFDVNISLGCFFFFLFAFYFLSLNIARQIAAVSIVLYAYSFLQYDNNRKYLFFIYVIFAATIHYSSIFFLLFFFIRFINISKSTFVMFAIGGFLYTFLPSNLLVNYFVSNNVLLTQYQQYLSHSDDFYDSSMGGIMIAFLMFILNIYIYIKLNNNNDTLDKLFITSVILDFLMFGAFGDIRRILLGLLIIKIVYYAKLFNLNRFNIGNMIFLTLSVLVYGYVIFSATSHGSNGIVPYSFSK